jgi:ABC-2 type transport system ATP-binding protein
VISSTPDALWNAPHLRLLRPAAVVCTDLRRGRDLDHCSLSVPAGGRVLLVSEPESTASTLLRVLAGLSPPEHGRIRIAGSSDPSADGWGRRVAYLGPHPGLHAWMTPMEALRLAADLVQLPRLAMVRHIERAVTWARIPASSLGQPMSRGGPQLLERTGLAAAILGDPEVLLLDEPLRALEAHERTRLLSIPGKRRTVLLASRYPASEVGLAAHVVFLREGRVQLIAPISELDSLSHRGITALAAKRPRAGAPPKPTPRAV